MGPHPEVPTLKKIYEAEREAERIVREAEAEAAALLRRADTEAAELLEARTRLLPLLHGRALEEVLSSAEKEAGELLESVKVRTEGWVKTQKAGVDRIVDRLLERVLPS